MFLTFAASTFMLFSFWKPSLSVYMKLVSQRMFSLYSALASSSNAVGHDIPSKLFEKEKKQNCGEQIVDCAQPSIDFVSTSQNRSQENIEFKGVVSPSPDDLRVSKSYIAVLAFLIILGWIMTSYGIGFNRNQFTGATW